MLSADEALYKTGSTEPCYQILRPDGSPIVGGVYSVKQKKTAPPVVPNRSREPASQRHHDNDGNEVGPWIHVYSRAEKREMRRVRKMYAGQTFQIRDD